jgi:hypothetical protein
MFYSAANYSSSEVVVEKSGFAFLNLGNFISAVQLDSGIKIDVSNISKYSDAPIRRFSEYAGIVYMYDGETVYRTDIKGKNLRRTVLSALQYEVMGDYIYSIKLFRGKYRLFRCRLNGSSEQLLFRHEVSRFWAYNGNLIMECQDTDSSQYSKFIFYNVVSGRSLDQLIPAGFTKICLDADGVYYAIPEEKSVSIFYRKYNEQIDTKIIDGYILDFAVGSGSLAVLVERNEKTGVLLLMKKSNTWTAMDSILFPIGSVIDLSQSNCYITSPDGKVWIARTGQPEWNRIY